MTKRTEAYLAGRLAYYDGRPAECPYPRTWRIERYQWYSGYYQTRTNDRLGHILRKHPDPEAKQ